MNCEDFESNVNDLAREQITDATVRTRALAHRDECEACSQRLEDHSALTFKLRALAADTNAVKVPSMGNELLAALRSQRPAMFRTAAASSWRHRALVTAAMAVAAMVLVVIAVTVMRSRSATPAVQSQSNKSIPQSQPPSNNEVVKALDLLSDPAPLPTKNPTLEGRKIKRHQVNRVALPSQAMAGADTNLTTEAATSVTTSPELEITTDFMPVGYASVANLQDGGQLVRVELPRSALVAFGLPMNVNRYDERVKADVFFGSDGMARAIRFVQ